MGILSKTSGLDDGLPRQREENGLEVAIEVIIAEGLSQGPETGGRRWGQRDGLAARRSLGRIATEADSAGTDGQGKGRRHSQMAHADGSPWGGQTLLGDGIQGPGLQGP
jgi:hypothetical protein